MAAIWLCICSYWATADALVSAGEVAWDLHGEDVLGVHARIHHREPLHGACEETRSGKQNNRDRDLRHHQ